MCSRSLRLIVTVALLSLLFPVLGKARDLRVCADPNNLPFSNMKQQGFENRIAALIAKDLGANLTYVWQRMGRGFVREYIDKSKCDLLIGIPSNFRPVLTTTPYYRSTYVFVSRRVRRLELAAGFDSPDLRRLKIGVQVLEEEYAPPGEALARRGLQAGIVGFDTTGDGAESIVRAVARREVDIAVVWGPLAGYFARRFPGSLTLTPVEPEVDPPGLPFTFAISMGVRKGNLALRDELEKILAKRQPEILNILDEYKVPQIPLISIARASSVN
ncbi:MAG: quinoprotein dehydrogenase-associated putative ABC transporter substrate-binding protein [Acidobacteria bacterium]|jgi:mxaJ protein|nr:MAG: quinoprotein dehydrogenase-associated putative ABC transporter substrate-binding protein [Acidobacteriota bacterium]